VTSIPGVLAPELAARIELMLIAGVVEVVDDRSELTADVELIASTCIPGRRHA
jgi:tRNA A37 threonylcarbamoyltransferase TsaD